MTSSRLVLSLALAALTPVAAAGPTRAQGVDMGCSFCGYRTGHATSCRSYSGGGGGSSSGTAAGQALGALFDAMAAADAQRAYERQQREAEEQARREAEATARRALATRLRESWDERDAEHARTLRSIFDSAPRRDRADPGRQDEPDPADLPLVPLEPFAAAPNVDPDVVDLRGTLEGGTPLAFEAWSRRSALDLEAQRRRAAATDAHARSLTSLGPATPSVGAGLPIPAFVLERLAAQPRAALDDLLDDLGPLDGEPPNALVAARRLYLCVESVEGGLDADRLTVLGREGGEAEALAAVQTLEGVQREVLEHVSDDDRLGVARALLDPEVQDAASARRAADRVLLDELTGTLEGKARAKLLPWKVLLGE